MNKKLVIVSLLAAFASAAFAGPKGGNPTEYVAGQLIVKFVGGPNPQSNAFLNKLGVRVIKASAFRGSQLITLPAGMSIKKATDYFRSLSSVEYAEPNGIVHTTIVPNDTNYNQQYGMKKISAETGWDLEKGSAAVTIAIVDTGVDMNHLDLQGKFVGGWNTITNSAGGQDDNGHGTHCAGIAAAVTNNSRGVAGVAWNCKIMPVKVLNSGGSGTWLDVAEGVDWASQHGAKVISMSLGGSGGSVELQNAVANAWNNGVIVSCAAGNNGSNSVFYPAGYPQAIAVGATDQNDNKAGFSNYGTSWVDVAAPGVSVYSTYLGGGYTTLDGTSMACPHVSGLAGLVWSRRGVSTPVATIRAAIEDNADPVGLSYWKYGRINVFKALNSGGGVPDVKPSSYNIFRGIADGGDLNSLVASDDNYLVVRNGAVALPSEAPITVTFDAVSGTQTASSMTFHQESRVSINNLNEGVDLYNFQSGTWVNQDAFAAPTSDSLRDYPVSNQNQYIENGTLAVRARITVRPGGALFTNTWRAYFDLISWTINP